jgi:hypothetical protein
MNGSTPSKLGRHPGTSAAIVSRAAVIPLVLPFGVAAGGPALVAPDVLLVGLAVALLSSVVPYALELTALRALAGREFGVLMSLEPAAAVLAGCSCSGRSSPRCSCSRSRWSSSRASGPPAPPPGLPCPPASLVDCDAPERGHAHHRIDEASHEVDGSHHSRSRRYADDQSGDLNWERGGVRTFRLTVEPDLQREVPPGAPPEDPAQRALPSSRRPPRSRPRDIECRLPHL